MAAVDGVLLQEGCLFDEEAPLSVQDGVLLAALTEVHEDRSTMFCSQDGVLLPDMAFDEEVSEHAVDGVWLPGMAFDEEVSEHAVDGVLLPGMSFDEERSLQFRDGVLLPGMSFAEEAVQTDITFRPPGRIEPIVNALSGLVITFDPGLDVIVNGRYVTGPITLVDPGYYAITVAQNSVPIAPPLPSSALRVQYRFCILPASVKVIIRDFVREDAVATRNGILANLPRAYARGESVDRIGRGQLDVQTDAAISLRVDMVRDDDSVTPIGTVEALGPGFWRSTGVALIPGSAMLKLSYELVTGPISIGLTPPSIGTFLTGQSYEALSMVPPVA